MSPSFIEAVAPSRPVWIFYKNWRGQNAWRYILPRGIWFGRTQHHPEDQWFLDATDLHKNVPRSFALKDIGRWQHEAPAMMEGA